MRGDDPFWGNEAGMTGRHEFPACAGMIRTLGNSLDSRVPRMRGDDPDKAVQAEMRSSPHARG